MTRPRSPGDDVCTGMDVPTDAWTAEDVRFWTGTARYQPWKDVAAFFKGQQPTAAARNHRTPEGEELGRRMAQWCDDAEPKARLRCPELPPRCNSCAFRAGRHLANGSPYTQMDALKCVIEGKAFICHEPGRNQTACSGWLMFMLAKDETDFGEAPWDFSGGTER